MMNKRLLLSLILPLLFLVGAAQAQTQGIDTSTPSATEVIETVEPVATVVPENESTFFGASWQFWAVLLVFFIIGFALNIAVNEHLTKLRNEVPDWVKMYTPAAYQHTMAGFETGVGYLKREAGKTTTPMDDELVEVFDRNGRKLIVKTAAILGYKVEDEDGGTPSAEANAGFPSSS